MSTSKPRAVLLALMWLLGSSAASVPVPVFGQATTQTPATGRATSEPYTGDLSIFEEKDRDQKLQIERVMDLLGIKPGSAVADVGAGSGWFAVRAAKRVGPAGHVYAVDINPAAVDYIRNRTRKAGLSNTESILSTPDDPMLRPSSVDAVLLLKTYHEVSHPVDLMKHIRAAVRPGGRVGIIDRTGNGADHGVGSDVVIREMREAGFSPAGNYDFVKPDRMDYFLIFQPSTN